MDKQGLSVLKRGETWLIDEYCTTSILVISLTVWESFLWWHGLNRGTSL